MLQADEIVKKNVNSSLQAHEVGNFTDCAASKTLQF